MATAPNCRTMLSPARSPSTQSSSEAANRPSPGSQPVGTVYISCSGRGGPHFGTPNAEMEIIAHALGDIPVVGMFANGEIARHHLYGYTGVLTVFGG